MNTKKNYQLSVITAATEAGFTFDMDDTMQEIWDAADNFLSEKEPYGHVFEQVDLNGPDYSQHYSWADDESDYTTDAGGEIITTNGQYTADEKVYYHREEDGTFTPVNWFDLPDEGDEKRREYIFVFAYHVKANGKVAYLYDYFC